jgi:hypothetical protein
MFAPAPIDSGFVPYTKRSVLKRNAGLFVDGTAGRGRGTPRVSLQQAGCVQFCTDKTDGMSCGANCKGVCYGGICR